MRNERSHSHGSIIAGLLHLDDPDRLRSTAASLAAAAAPVLETLGERERRQWAMLFAQLLGTGRHWLPLGEALALLWAVGPWREELRQLLVLLADRADHRLHPLPWAQPVPLRVHGRTCREEGAPRSHREGVLWHEPSQCDLLYVTLRKSEALFSPTTRYRDLVLGPSLFHWESQSTITAASATGQRYIHHGAWGAAGAVVCAGGAQAGQRHRAVRVPGVRALREPRGRADLLCPRVAIRWRLEREIPAGWLPGCCLA